MASFTKIQQRLKTFDLVGLFTQELLWNNFKDRDLDIQVDGTHYTLSPVAEQSGMAVYGCSPATAADFPDYPTRRKIDNRVAKIVREHIVIYQDPAKQFQIWQWVKREAGKASACREQRFQVHQTGDALIQKLLQITFSLEDEPTIGEAREKVKRAFDLEKVTKRFYDEFKKQHGAFLKFLKGIPDEHLQRWYASVMLNRLMFIYFIQKKGFLGGDLNYLRNKLAESKKHGKDEFYREFLCPLFFEGFAMREPDRSAKTKQLLGNIPYLNGGLFLKHQIEQSHGKAIEIADSAFDKIFGFFDMYQWHLDDRPTREGNEINPDVLGYVFEKYINQKEMGAYYTKEDITGYISQNTIIPAVFDAARKGCKVAFEGEHCIWNLLKEDPDRYFYAAVLHGTEKELTKNIAAGINDVSERSEWNKTAPEEYGLPTETWREVIARRQRYEEVRAKLAAGEVRSLNDLITYNLDIQRFAEEVISNAEGADLVWAFYKSVEKLSVLDPTCGSGAFLFAALNILEKLYDTCLVRMQAFVDDLDRSGQKHSSKKFEHFRQKLAEMNDKSRHPSPRYFILKSIVLNNLYGVDIMEEATEICKLRLFLKLVAQVSAGDQIEPLPDIDFNIRPGNTLVGFTTDAELRAALSENLGFDDAYKAINEHAELADKAFRRFREMQLEYDMNSSEFSAAKVEVGRRLEALRTELDSYLCGDYGVSPSDKRSFDKWKSTHQPFHWYVEFFGIFKDGGFGVVIGNPPYVVYPNKNIHYRIPEKLFQTLPTRNLYCFVFERAVKLTKLDGPIGLIVQLTVMTSERLQSLQSLLQHRGGLQLVPFPRRPESVFSDVEMPVAIVISSSPELRQDIPFTTSSVNRFYTDERPHAMACLEFIRHPFRKNQHRIAKLGSSVEVSVYQKVFEQNSAPLGTLACGDSPWSVYYQEACRYWVKANAGNPYFVRNGHQIDPPHGRTIDFVTEKAASFVTCLLNSSLFYWAYSALCDCEHINDSFVREFPIPPLWAEVDWKSLCDGLLASLRRNATRKTISTKQGHKIEYDEIKAVNSKLVIDNIDRALSHLYGLSGQELELVINYDIKYRAGDRAVEESNDVAAASADCL